MTSVSFQPFASGVSVNFWQALTKRKLDEWKLSDSAVDVQGAYASGSSEALPARLLLEGDAFDGAQYAPPARHFPVCGTLRNFNTIEDFRNVDKKELFAQAVTRVWNDVASGAALRDPSLLNRFLVLAFADLKKYKYYYWFAFPALMFDDLAVRSTRCEPLAARFSGTLDAAARHFPLCPNNALRGTEVQCHTLRDAFGGERGPAAYFLYRVDGDAVVVERDLTQFDAFLRDDAQGGVGFADPCALVTNPGWPLRNLLVLVARAMKRDSVSVLCYRENFHGGVHDIGSSIVLDVCGLASAGSVATQAAEQAPKATGWEKNRKGKLLPRVIDLADSMDPARLAATAVDLNLKLMRWRLLPSVELEKLRDTKCLLLGSGTLGCNVARQLLSWGVRHITMLDYGRVSFSNPVRQSLFEFDDCLNGGRKKAIAAAEKLRKIFPEVEARGVHMSIPMPGHSIAAGHDAEVEADVARLTELIQTHDAVYLLMDSRESRWLPTLLCAAEQKLCITTALGFDTFVVMRHGVCDDTDDDDVAPPPPSGGAPTRLGCYFCNDVVAPRDSLADRTLDQQCTVTRPAVSMLASALAVELMVGVVHHPLGVRAPADEAQDVATPTSSELGLLPHQVRGFLSHVSNMLLLGHAYDRCTACSKRVVRAYKSDGFAFVRKVLNDPAFLEEVAGLKELESAEGEEIEWVGGEEDDFDF